jgi:hypothetical protein
MNSLPQFSKFENNSKRMNNPIFKFSKHLSRVGAYMGEGLPSMLEALGSIPRT